MSQNQLSSAEFNELKGRYDARAVRSHSINTRCYTEPKFLGIEREQIFHRSWQFLCHEERLRNPGDYVSSSIEGRRSGPGCRMAARSRRLRSSRTLPGQG